VSIHYVFDVGSLHMALPAESVIHCLKDPVITPAPVGPSWLLGVLSCDGRPVPAIDLPALLDIEHITGQSAGAPWLIVARTLKGPIAWAVSGEPVAVHDIELDDSGGLDEVLTGTARTLVLDSGLLVHFIDHAVDRRRPASPTS
jgi:hypothetical protein